MLQTDLNASVCSVKKIYIYIYSRRTVVLLRALGALVSTPGDDPLSALSIQGRLSLFFCLSICSPLIPSDCLVGVPVNLRPGLIKRE